MKVLTNDTSNAACNLRMRHTVMGMADSERTARIGS